MLELDEYKLELQKYRQPLQEVKASLDIEGKENRIAELDKAMAEPGFWDDVEKSGQIMKEMKGLKGTIESFNTIRQDFEDLETMIEMAVNRYADELEIPVSDVEEEYLEENE